MMKSILITGASGFIGKNLTESYKTKKINLICLSSKKQLFKKKNIKWIKLDKNYNKLKYKKIKFDIIFISTGIGSISQSNQINETKREAKVFDNILHLIKNNKNKCKIIFLSSYSVYGNCLKKKRENDQYSPLSIYAKNKIKFEKKLKKFSKLKKDHVIILRLSSLYGPFLKKQIIFDTLLKIQEKKKIIFKGFGKETRDFMYIDDAIKAMDLVLRKKNLRNFQIYNCGSGQLISIKNLIFLLFKLIKFNKKPYFDKKFEKINPMNLKININKLKRIKFNPSYTLETGLRRYLKWFKKI